MFIVLAKDNRYQYKKRELIRTIIHKTNKSGVKKAHLLIKVK